MVSETFRGKFSFRHAGLKDATMREQLESFRESLVEFGHSKCPELKGWLQAFHELEVLLSRKKAARKVVFIDEMPWMDTPKSGFLTALESFWNKWACSRKDIVFVICGSATSWIVKKVLRSRGGMTRDEIVRRLGNVSGGNVTRELDELEECGFIRRYQIPGSKVKGAIFQLVDHFTLFHFSFLDGEKITSGDFWSSSAALHRKEAWRGLAFERLCLDHVSQIKFKLGISGVFTREYAWRGSRSRRRHRQGTRRYRHAPCRSI